MNDIRLLAKKGNYCIKHDIVKFDCKFCKRFINEMTELITETEKMIEIDSQITDLKRRKKDLFKKGDKKIKYELI